MTQAGEKTWIPELFFAFTTMFIYDFKTKKILWTLQKDRQEKNLWVPPGGEWEAPKPNQNLSLVEIGQDGLRECFEEVDVKVKILGTGPFYECVIPYGYPDYGAAIYHKNQRISQREGAHSLLLYYLTEIISGTPRCKPQPNEPDYEIVDFCWLTIKKSIQKFKTEEMKTYASALEALNRLNWLISQKQNPFLISYKS